MAWDMPRLKKALGHLYSKTMEYVLARHKDVPDKVEAGWAVVMEVPDATMNEGGTMVVMCRPLAPEEDDDEEPPGFRVRMARARVKRQQNRYLRRLPNV